MWEWRTDFYLVYCWWVNLGYMNLFFNICKEKARKREGRSEHFDGKYNICFMYDFEDEDVAVRRSTKTGSHQPSRHQLNF